MLAGKTLLDYTNFFCPNDYKNNDKMICNSLKIDMVQEASIEKKLVKQEIIF